MKIRKMLHRNHKKGMTLVELIISTAAGAVVIAAACSVLYFGYNNYTSGTTDLTNHQNASLLESYFQHDLATATSVTVEEAKQSSAASSADGIKSTEDKIICMHFDNKVLVIEEKDNLGTSTTRIAGIESVSLNTVDVGTAKKLNYEIKASSKNERSFVLTGGIVLNNCTDCTVATIPYTDKTHYFNIQMPKVTMQSST